MKDRATKRLVGLKNPLEQHVLVEIMKGGGWLTCAFRVRAEPNSNQNRKDVEWRGSGLVVKLSLTVS